MTYFPDMGTRTMIDAGDHIRAVGWLSAKQPFADGEVPADFLARLREFANKWGASIDALGWGAYGGPHCCEFCGEFRSSGNFGVPSGELLFAVPQMIVHYVEAHRYRPPEEFIVAVLKSPIPGTHDYRALTEPFRRLHERYLEQRRQQHIQYVGRWAFERGGTEDAVREAALRFFGDRTPEICESIRGAMPGAARADSSAPVVSSPSDGRNGHSVP
jgi:hypothetical protein